MWPTCLVLGMQWEEEGRVRARATQEEGGLARPTRLLQNTTGEVGVDVHTYCKDRSGRDGR